MNLIRALAILIVVLISGHSIAQSKLPIDSVFLKTISKQVKEEILNSYKNDSTFIKGDCYYRNFNGIMAPLSCFEIEWNRNWVGDINKDGEDDIILRVEDDGLGGGGNAYGYDYYVIYLKNREIVKMDTIYGGGKLSNAFLNLDSISHSTIYTTLSENGIYVSNWDSTTQLKEIKLQFIWNKDRLVEKSYLKCPFRTMDKTIFKPEMFGVKRKLYFNELYEEEQNEEITMNNKVVGAFFSGCKTLELFFSIDRPFDQRLELDSTYAKSELLNELSFLRNSTKFANLFESIIFDIQKNGIFLQKTRPLSNAWSYYSVISSYSDDYGTMSHICIRLINRNTKEIIPDFWEEIRR